jgi:hypothetical protein
VKGEDIFIGEERILVFYGFFFFQRTFDPGFHTYKFFAGSLGLDLRFVLQISKPIQFQFWHYFSKFKNLWACFKNRV